MRCMCRGLCCIARLGPRDMSSHTLALCYPLSVATDCHLASPLFCITLCHDGTNPFRPCKVRAPPRMSSGSQLSPCFPKFQGGCLEQRDWNCPLPFARGDLSKMLDGPLRISDALLNTPSCSRRPVNALELQGGSVGLAEVAIDLIMVDL